FYARLLGWEVTTEEDNWVVINGPESVGIAFERDINYQPPVWPTEPGKPPMQMHLEVQVSDLGAALHHALEGGATLAEHQPQDDVRVCLDPAGHPFCLWLNADGA
ncbi:MAG: VOC family protein, partial [Actinomycetota bacterium]|nr:VOC family protein [Actinomycetota bacterium]